MITCSQCGENMPDNLKFCGNCGVPLAPPRLSTEYLLEKLPFHQPSKDLFLQFYNKLDIDRKGKVVDVVWDAWTSLQQVRREEIIQNQGLVERYANYIEGLPPNRPQIDERWIGLQMRQDLEKWPNSFSYQIVNLTEGILRKIYGF